MAENIGKGNIDPKIFDRMQSGEPVAVYVKTIVGKLGVVVWNHFENKPDYRILEGDPRDPDVDLENITIKLWSDVDKTYFLNSNKEHVLEGKLSETEAGKLPELVTSNMLTEREIEEILGQPFFTLDNKLKELTSDVPVRRILEKAVEMNRPIKTINHIKARLVEIQEEQGLDQVAIDEYYRDLQI